MTRLSLLLMIFSLSACAGVGRPDTDLCVVNAAFDEIECYNLREDYSEEGKLKPGAKVEVKDILSLSDLDKHVCTTPDGFAELKAYINLLRDRLKRAEAGGN